MKKTANAAHQIESLIAERWSPRAFLEKPVEREKLLSMFEAAKWAPSAFNAQPWRFLAAEKSDAADYAKMLSCLAEANQTWAGKAPVLMILLAKKTFAYNGKPNRWAMHDCGLALENLLLETQALGLAAHPMAGFSVDAVREKYSVPEDYEPLVAIAAGYEGDPDQLSGDLKTRELEPRERNPLEKFVFSKEWERSL